MSRRLREGRRLHHHPHEADFLLPAVWGARRRRRHGRAHTGLHQESKHSNSSPAGSPLTRRSPGRHSGRRRNHPRLVPRPQRRTRSSSSARGVDPRGTLAETVLEPSSANSIFPRTYAAKSCAGTPASRRCSPSTAISSQASLRRSSARFSTRTPRRSGANYRPLRRLCGDARPLRLRARQACHVGEGVETCLAARQLGLRPAWALGSLSQIANFPVLAGIESLTLSARERRRRKRRRPARSARCDGMRRGAR